MNTAETISLIELAKSGANLKSLDQTQVHFTNEGTEALSKVEMNHFWCTERRNLIFSLLKKFSPDAAIGADVGCGTGYTAVWLTERGFPTMGIDALAGFQAYQIAGRGVGFLQGDILSVEPKAEFDFILLLDTLEHIDDDRGFFDHVCKMVKPGGRIIISVPAFQWLWSSIDSRGGHLRRYEEKDLKTFERLSSTRLTRLFSTYYYLTTLPLYYFARKFLVDEKRAVTDSIEKPPYEIINQALKVVLKVEAFFASRMRLPVGSSLFVVFQKE